MKKSKLFKIAEIVDQTHPQQQQNVAKNGTNQKCSKFSPMVGKIGNKKGDPFVGIGNKIGGKVNHGILCDWQSSGFR